MSARASTRERTSDACDLLTKRLVMVIPNLIGVVIVTFLLTRVLPGDPAAYFAGPAATPQSIAEIRKPARPRQAAARAVRAATSTISRTAISAIRSPPASRC